MTIGAVAPHILSPQAFHRAWPLLRLGFVLAGTLGALRRWKRFPRERWVWGWIGFTLLCWSVEDVLFLFTTGPGQDIPGGFLGTAVLPGVLLAMPLALLGWPERPGLPETSRGRHILDGLLFAYAALFFAWLVGLRIWMKDIPTFDLLGGLRTLSLLAWALILGICVHHGARDPARWKGPLAWVGAYFGLTTLLNAILMGNSLGTSLGMPGDTALLLKLGALACFPAAAWWPVPAEGEPSPASETFSRILPYAPATLAIGASVWVVAFYPDRVGAELFALGLPLMVLLLGRQWLALRDLHQFSLALEQKVIQRTQALEASQRLVLSTERMNTMASLGAGLAHDLNNLLGITKNYAELALQQLEQGEEVSHRNLLRIQESATRAGEFTAQLMAFGRQQGMPLATFCVRDFLQSHLGLFSMVARPPVQVILETGSESLPVTLSPSQVDQLLVNLLSNARDAMPRGGRIWLRAASGNLPDGRPAALLEVEDEGLGMPAALLGRIFDPFFTTKEPGRGTGLGLASVKSLVEGWEGHLDVESREGQGTRFCIHIPLAVE